MQINDRVRSVFSDKSYDVCIIGESPIYSPALLYVMRKASKISLPVVIWTEGIDTENRSPATLSNVFWKISRRAYDTTIRRWTYSYSDFFIAYSGDMTKQFLERRDVDENKVQTGIQVMPKSLLGSKQGTKNKKDTYTILYLGYLLQRKGIDVLIDAYKEMQIPSTELIIAGDGPDKNRLQSRASNSDSIRFTGFVSDDLKWKLYRTADLFILPTFHDTWGLVVNEALFFGTPTITTGAAGVSQLVRENNAGTVVPSRDADQLRDAIVEICESPELQSTYERNAAACDMAWDPEVGAAPFLKIIDRVTKQS
jgi:glycosyltransferase involved in cell wall biosynthesis